MVGLFLGIDIKHQALWVVASGNKLPLSCLRADLIDLRHSISLLHVVWGFL